MELGSKPIRVLHVLGQLQHGGCETWLYGVLRHIDRARFHTDIVLHSTHAPLADTFRALGARLVVCDHHRNPWRYRSRLLGHLRTAGPYQVVHSHVYHYSGFVLALARTAGVPVRIAHAHNDLRDDDARRSLVRRRYVALMHRWIRACATTGLGASSNAMSALFGPGWEADSSRRILHCGIDLAPFHNPPDRTAVRRELGIPPDAWVIGHVGRLVPLKNQAFLVDVLAAARERCRTVVLLLIGDGPSRQSLEADVRRRGLDGSVVFAGARNDVPRLLMGAVDTFAMPSLSEALPLALLEAQAAGLPCVVTDRISHEADALSHLVRRVRLTEGVSAWKEALLTATPRDPGAARRMTHSAFDIVRNVRDLEAIYATDA